MTLTFDLVTPKLVWRVELIKVHLRMKFEGCRWKHFYLRANVKVFWRTAHDDRAMTIPRVFSENSRAKKPFKVMGPLPISLDIHKEQVCEVSNHSLQ